MHWQWQWHRHHCLGLTLRCSRCSSASTQADPSLSSNYPLPVALCNSLYLPSPFSLPCVPTHTNPGSAQRGKLLPTLGLDACKMPVTSSPLGFGFSELRGFHVLAKQPHRATALQGLQASFPAILLTSPNHGHEAEGFWSQHRQYSAGQRIVRQWPAPANIVHKDAAVWMLSCMLF